MTNRRCLPRSRLASVLLAGAVAAFGAEAAEYRQAVRMAGPLPVTPHNVSAGGEVILEIEVTDQGRVGEMLVLRDTPPFTELVAAAVAQWWFEPAELDGEPVGSRVLVAGVFRPPSLHALGVGTPPRDVGLPSDLVPYPVEISHPPYPPRARGAGTILLALGIDTRGQLLVAQVAEGGPPFSEVAMRAVEQWVFAPASLFGVPVDTIAYAIFGFPEPVLAGPFTPPPR
jgi:hypothetical protein